MKIIELRAENLKRLKAVEIRPDGNMVQVTGKNGQGKTSVLDAIWYALATQRVVPAQPIRKGCEQARIRIDMGELVVTRTYTRKEGDDYTMGLKVETAEGTRLPSPQDVLNALVGELSFDPLEFSRKPAKEQFDTLRGIVQGIDFEGIAEADQKDRDERTVLNRRAKELRAQAEGIALPAGAVPRRVDVGALEADLAGASKVNAEIEQRRTRRDAAGTIADERDMKALKLRQQAAELIRDAEAEEAEAMKVRKMLAEAEALADLIDVDDVLARLNAARAGNAVAARAEEKAAILARAGAAEEDSKALTKRMEAREAAKQAAIAEASMPVNGMGFGEDFITLDGVPFEQASDAEQLRASLAIATALNPKLRVVRIRDGSLLDEDALRWVAEFADQHDMQVWIEKVDSSGAVGFVLEDGHLKTDQDEEAI